MDQSWIPLSYSELPRNQTIHIESDHAMLLRLSTSKASQDFSENVTLLFIKQAFSTPQKSHLLFLAASLFFFITKFNVEFPENLSLQK